MYLSVHGGGGGGAARGYWNQSDTDFISSLQVVENTPGPRNRNGQATIEAVLAAPATLPGDWSKERERAMQVLIFLLALYPGL
jgi:hypothetical protein